MPTNYAAVNHSLPDRPRRRTTSWIVALLFIAVASPQLRGDDRTAADLLPSTTAVYAELPSPHALIDQLTNHPVVQRLISSPDYQAALANPQLTQLRAAVTVVELAMGSTRQEIVRTGFGGGVVVAVDTRTEGAVLLVRATNSDVLPKLRDAIVRLARQEANRQGQGDRLKSAEYRGIQAYEVNQAKMAVVDQWLVVTNKGELGKDVLDRYLDKGADSLASRESFQTARAFAGTGNTAWAFVDLKVLRDAGAAKELLGGKADNPVAELLLGGVLSTLHHAPFAVAGLRIRDDHVGLRFSTPHDPAWIEPAREFFFGPDSAGRAPELISLPGTIASVSAYRDISAMWLRAGDLFNKEVNDQLAAADSNLTTLFSGRDFGEDILGAIRPELQLVVTRQDFSHTDHPPSIKLPAFALVAELKEPDRMQPELRRTFQSLIGFLNVVGAMNGQPQLDLADESGDQFRLVYATFVPEVDRKPDQGGKIQFNFSPSIAFTGNRVIVASSAALARALITDTTQEKPRPDDSANTALRIDAHALRAVLNDNQAQLIAQNMLEKGHSREEAEKEIGGLLALLEVFDSLRIELRARDRMTLDVRLGLK